MKFKIALELWILCIFTFSLVSSVTVKHNDDPNVPDETDMDIIEKYTNDKSDARKEELDKDNKNQSLENPDESNPDAGTTSTTTTTTAAPPSPPPENVQHLKDGEPCKCVKYYLCSVEASSNSTGENGTLQGVAEDGSVILGSVDIRRTELKNKANESNSNSTEVNAEHAEDIPIECPHYFDVCCPIKNIKEPKPESKPNPDNATTTEKPQPPPPKDSSEYEHTTCGKRNENGVGFKVTGATEGEAQFGEFPWTAAIIQLEANEDNVTINKYIGGGSLIHPQVVMTVAHGVLGKARTTIRVRLGEWDTQTNDEPYPSQDRGVSKVIIHERFLKTTLFNDIALLILDEEVRLAPNVETICLPPLNRKLKFEGQICFSSGWGKNNFGAAGRYSEIMKRVSVPIVSKDECQKELEKSDRLPGFRLHKSFICAGGKDSEDDTCKGDGGSPLVCSISGKSGKHYVQVGAVSWGLGCKNASFPGVYSDIMYLTPWILKHMDKEGMSTDYFATQN